MAFDETNGSGIPATMLVGPTGYGNGGFGGGFGGDWAWIIILLLAFNGGFGGWGGMGGFGGYGNMMLGYDFPWLLNGQQGINNNVSSGFRDAQLSDSITSVRDGISSLSTQLCGCCGDIQNSLCSGFAGVTASVTGAQNALAQQMYANQIADMERSYAAQTASTQGFTGVMSGIADLRYTEATEACATRTAAATNTRDIIDSQTRGIQTILDKLCQLELDGYKRENDSLRSQLTDARFAASQVEQTAQIRAAQAVTANQLVSELRSCPIPSQPVYGNQPIFTCGGTGCGCGNGFAN
jgi:hypothetical protein